MVFCYFNNLTSHLKNDIINIVWRIPIHDLSTEPTTYHENRECTNSVSRGVSNLCCHLRRLRKFNNLSLGIQAGITRMVLPRRRSGILRHLHFAPSVGKPPTAPISKYMAPRTTTHEKKALMKPQ